ncbi:NADPH-dependent F420 reductase [Euzebya sp.]|uniref:NADPH-dependent F420 reductase n=1 Tax=Euzebya sp. TaxID=1971409 RepID=UPI003511E865
MIGIIGGTGPQGRGLALRFARAGLDVLIGSRDPARAADVAADVPRGDGAGVVEGAANGDLPGRCDVLVLTVPYDALDATLGQLADAVGDHLVLSAVNNMGFEDGRPVPLEVPAGSAAHEIAARWPDARVCTAFNTVSAVHLRNLDHDFDEDVLVCGDDRDAVAAVTALIDRIEGLRGVDVGDLAQAATVEAMTPMIVSINKRNGVNAGVRIVGLDP